MYKTIQRHPNYEINEKGDVKRKGKDTPMKPYPVNGHPKLILDGKTEYVSRLVAETFIFKPEGKDEVNHIDRDLSNNHSDNLEWETHAVIQKQSYRGYLAPGGREHSKKIMIVETGEVFPSIRECARIIGGTPSGIRQCLNNKIGSYRGFHFKILN